MIIYSFPPQPTVSVSVPPIEFTLNGVNTPVSEDTLDPSNNTPLPAGIYFEKDGVKVPVNEDTVDPAQSTPFPVKLVGLTGDVNITAGDLNVSTDSTNDSMAIGDSVTGDKVAVSANDDAVTYALKVKDDDANQKLSDIEASVQAIEVIDFATEATLQTLATEATLGDVKTATEAIASVDFATESTLDAVKTAVETLDDVVATDGNPAPANGVVIGGVDSNGDFQQVGVNASGELLVNMSTGAGGLASEATLDEMNNKFNQDFGSPTTGVRTAAQIGNAIGAADFNAGADSAQTLRVSANLKRAGNELSYNSGAPDANTLRTVIATGHGLATEAKQDALKAVVGATNDPNVFGPSDDGTIVSILKGIRYWLYTLDVRMQTLEADAAPLVGSYDENLSFDDTAAITLVKPSGAKWCKVLNLGDNNLRIKIGATATKTSGFRMEPGRSEDFSGMGDISVITESGAGAVCVQWGA